MMSGNLGRYKAIGNNIIAETHTISGARTLTPYYKHEGERMNHSKTKTD